jgi:hypothetical protein
MDEPGHVSLGEFNAASGSVFVAHK